MAEEPVAPRRRSVQCASPRGLHRIAYLEWGDPRNRDVLLCVHGLTRSSRDFDDLAHALCARFRVVCPDVAGRGDSDRLLDASLYAVPHYVSDMVTLIARLDVEAVSWVGTSLGGLIGMALAAQPQSPIARLVLNDAGPVVTRGSLERIAGYLGTRMQFQSVEEAEAYAFHRGAFQIYESDRVTLRRCYVNSRDHADLPGCSPEVDPELPYCSYPAEAGDNAFGIWADVTDVRFELLPLLVQQEAR
jgi:pimeloyl-ACP methyl ester carboxylesterase